MIPKNAFTLIELIIIIAIIGITSFFSVPAILRFRAAVFLNAAASQIQSDLNLIKQKAISRGTGYELFCKDNYCSIRVQNIMSNTFEEINKSALPSNITFINSISFRFAPSGFPIPGYFGGAVLNNKYLKTRKIIVSSVGRIRVE